MRVLLGLLLLLPLGCASPVRGGAWTVPVDEAEQSGAVRRTRPKDDPPPPVQARPQSVVDSDPETRRAMQAVGSGGEDDAGAVASAARRVERARARDEHDHDRELLARINREQAQREAEHALALEDARREWKQEERLQVQEILSVAHERALREQIPVGEAAAQLAGSAHVEAAKARREACTSAERAREAFHALQVVMEASGRLPGREADAVEVQARALRLDLVAARAETLASWADLAAERARGRP